mgnify:CR=1 FL=1
MDFMENPCHLRFWYFKAVLYAGCLLSTGM